MKIYLASPFFDEEQVERVKRVEKALADNPTVTEVFSPRLQQVEHLEHGSDEWRDFVYNNDIKYIEWCDAVVAVHDYVGEHVDPGTGFEIGYGKALNKFIVLYQEKDPVTEAPVNLMLTDSLDVYIQDIDKLAKYDFNEKKRKRFENYSFAPIAKEK
ncbi:nucleoside 2-deoxyribosyltransferase [Jeotgalicoccus coquinae]|uniref:Nucleoside deoxyribosyltransferase n=1 Tax=Jeotgalicoccus coquinae TaxID=709509 RepID=A0A6V7R0G8_9STAP|nr:nucleoside 2-deoxyribosyltransferase [Jeotgalicoccus coquinae]MBB6423761.1 nucleoside deoxyribosyltransferase [Jeotgalicoccus coquinae]GGE22381.1 nucleoside 2-deoxyribosyltransferase [Jeotgalicoccus coquinae]CAD2070796.1 Nucleoside deoxyribosyltransferase [Jeotgalicoccus coquinae]